MAQIALDNLPAAAEWANWVGNRSFTPAFAAAVDRVVKRAHDPADMSCSNHPVPRAA